MSSSTDPWSVEPASVESVSEAEDWAASILWSADLLPAATATGFEVPCLPRTASFVALWATLRLLHTRGRLSHSRKLARRFGSPVGSSEVVRLVQVASLPKVPCTPITGSQVAKSRVPLCHQATWTVPGDFSTPCAGYGGPWHFSSFMKKITYTYLAR